MPSENKRWVYEVTEGSALHLLAYRQSCDVSKVRNMKE